MYVDTDKTEMVKVAINKSLVKEFETSEGRTVYLRNGDEFQIQLYNPTDNDIAASVFIDGEELSNQLVIRPAQRIWLERYLDVAKKFKFNTYEVEDTTETEGAISKNGNIEVRFYKKDTSRRRNDYLTVSCEPIIKDISISTPNIYYTSALNCCDAKLNCTSIADISSMCAVNSNDGLISKGISTDSSMYCCTNAINDTASLDLDTRAISASIETGRTEKGSYSSQKFEDVNMDFVSYAFKTEKIKILPISRKPYTANDLEKIYCSECGRKLKTKYKFCPYCGTKIDY